MPARALRLHSVELFERPVTLRLPFRFGAATVTRCPQAFVRVEADVDGKRLWQQEVSSAATGGQWKDWEIDLSAYKGQRVWVVVRHLPRDSDATCSVWGKIELMK